MRSVVLHPVGIEITGVELRRLSSSTAEVLEGLLAEHGVVILPGQATDDLSFVAALRRFGDLTFTRGETAVPGCPDLNVVSNIGRTTPPRSTFHVDTSYVRHPPAYTALRAVRIPARGGDTLFTNQYRAFTTLPSEVERHLEGRTVTHVMTGLDLGEDAETQAEHPVFRLHPISRRTSLYLTTPKRCVAVSGLTPGESERTIKFLYDHSTKEDNTLRHTWSAGDVVMWDNRCVMHRADHTNVVGDRLLHRGMVAG